MGEEIPRSLKDYMYPTRASQPSCIVLPETAGQFELKASTIHMLHVFRGVDAENPYHHVREFEEICGTLRFTQMPEESLKLRLFPFYLKEKAKSWLYSLQPESIRTWDDLTKEFFRKFFQNHKTATIHQSLDVGARTTVESMCNGLFIDKSADESWTFLIEVAEKTQQWESIREPRKTAPVADVHRIESDFEGNAKIASLARRVEALELQKNVKPYASTIRDHVEMSICAACNSSDHLVDSCPEIVAFQESRLEHANALYHKQENNPCSQTYNPGWRNHPRFSWSKGPVQGGTPGNTQGYSYPRNPQMQLYTQHPSEKIFSSIEESVGLLTQNLLQNQKTTDQCFTSLEIKIVQICDALDEREKGRFPSQPQQNTKGTFQSSISTCNETAHVVTTLRSGKVVDNNVGVPQTSESKSDSSLHATPQKTSIVENKFEHVCKSKNFTDVNVSLPTNIPVAPFPQRLVQQKKSTHFNEMLEMFKRVNINIPFLEAINQIPVYAKFLKDLCTQKRKLNLGLGELKPTPITLQLADRSVKVPRGVVEDVLIKVDKFYFPVDFIVLDTQPLQNHDCHIPVILGRPFLATSNAIINCRNGVLKLSFGNMNVELNVFNVSQQPMDLDDNDVHEINMIESLIQDSLSNTLSVDPLQACMENINLDLYDSEYISEVHSLLESVPHMDVTKWQTKVELLPLSDSKSVPSLVEPPKLELKPLPDTLKYAFLGSSNTFPVVISSALDI
ncbi:uncharacterized protein LOC113306058 [Papaver somniferum]|uniref:uncharacterized protein LOC113306058 n=1 Tax=Papaver somniferum TaxID=3469 RepID=UPI000E703F27|nr:uncharacterized protein LOC113306058 [Papaver somniferum]